MLLQLGLPRPELWRLRQEILLIFSYREISLPIIVIVRYLSLDLAVSIVQLSYWWNLVEELPLLLKELVSFGYLLVI